MSSSGPRGEDNIPIWNLYVPNTGPIHRVRAIHMDRPFAVHKETGHKKGSAGQWIVDDDREKTMKTYSDAAFKAAFTAVDPTRPETIQQPASAAEKI